jgi:hypothetical protein
MDNIITFFKLLFFSKVVLLTPHPVNIDSKYSLVLNEPINAITHGAVLEIDVSNMFQSRNITLINVSEIVMKNIPPNSVKAYLHTDKIDKTISLFFNRGISWSGNNEIRIILSNPEKMKTDVDFQKIKIETKVPLEQVKIYWNTSAK